MPETRYLDYYLARCTLSDKPWKPLTIGKTRALYLWRVDLQCLLDAASDIAKRVAQEDYVARRKCDITQRWPV